MIISQEEFVKRVKEANKKGTLLKDIGFWNEHAGSKHTGKSIPELIDISYKEWNTGTEFCTAFRSEKELADLLYKTLLREGGGIVYTEAKNTLGNSIHIKYNNTMGEPWRGIEHDGTRFREKETNVVSFTFRVSNRPPFGISLVTAYPNIAVKNAAYTGRDLRGDMAKTDLYKTATPTHKTFLELASNGSKFSGGYDKSKDAFAIIKTKNGKRDTLQVFPDKALFGHEDLNSGSGRVWNLNVPEKKQNFEKCMPNAAKYVKAVMGRQQELMNDKNISVETTR